MSKAPKAMRDMKSELSNLFNVPPGNVTVINRPSVRWLHSDGGGNMFVIDYSVGLGRKEWCME